LAVLAELAVAELPPADPDFPHPMPTGRELASDASRSRLASALALPARLSRVGEAIGQLGPSLRATASRTSLNRPTSARRRFRFVSYPLPDIRNAAHLYGATVNDVALSMIASALRHLLEARGECLDHVVISVPISSRAATASGTLGNASGAVPLRFPANGEPRDLLRQIAGITRAAKSATRGNSTAVLGPLFRTLARLGLFQRFLDGQRTIHTIVTDIRGPSASLTIGGIPVSDIVPLTAIVGNVTVAFAVSSYVDRLSITVVADPDACADLDDLSRLIDDQFHRLTDVLPGQARHGTFDSGLVDPARADSGYT
jgi:hypothetical protein